MWAVIEAAAFWWIAFVVSATVYNATQLVREFRSIRDKRTQAVKAWIDAQAFAEGIERATPFAPPAPTNTAIITTGENNTTLIEHIAADPPVPIPIPTPTAPIEEIEGVEEPRAPEVEHSGHIGLYQRLQSEASRTRNGSAPPPTRPRGRTGEPLLLSLA